MESGKFDEELRRMSGIADALTPHSLLLFNESFAATNEREGSEIARQIVRALLETGVKVFFVTHLYEFAHGFCDDKMDSAIFLRAERQADGRRTFKLAPGEPLQTSFGIDLYEKIFRAAGAEKLGENDSLLETRPPPMSMESKPALTVNQSGAVERPPHRRRKISASFVAVAVSQDNFHPIVAGIAYRSGQMGGDKLERTVERYGIKSIINLRGENAAAEWYREETEVAKRSHVIHYDMRLSSGQELSPSQMDELVALMKSAPKPVLIHCDGGADRSALASALYRFAIEGEAPEEAEQELSVWYGHAPLFRPRVRAMDRSFQSYVYSHGRARN